MIPKTVTPSSSIADQNRYEVYCVTNSVNGKRYIGQTSYGSDLRWQRHVYLAEHNAYTRFYSAIRKYGHDKFNIEVIQRSLSADEANSTERKWIAKFETTEKQFGYNMTPGGDNGNEGRVMSENGKKSMKAAGEKRRNRPILARTRKTDELHRPVVEGFKSGKLRSELQKEFGLKRMHVVKILLRWKRLHEPDLHVGKDFQYESSKVSNRKRIDKNHKEIIDLFQSGLTRKQISSQLNVPYGHVKQVIHRHIKQNLDQH